MKESEEIRRAMQPLELIRRVCSTRLTFDAICEIDYLRFKYCSVIDMAQILVSLSLTKCKIVYMRPQTHIGTKCWEWE
jgi:chorismate mutase